MLWRGSVIFCFSKHQNVDVDSATGRIMPPKFGTESIDDFTCDHMSSLI